MRKVLHGFRRGPTVNPRSLCGRWGRMKPNLGFSLHIAIGVPLIPGSRYWLSFQRNLFSAGPLWLDLNGIWLLMCPWVEKGFALWAYFPVMRFKKYIYIYIFPLPMWKIDVHFYISVISLSSDFQIICSGMRTPPPPTRPTVWPRTAEPTVKTLPTRVSEWSLSSQWSLCPESQKCCPCAGDKGGNGFEWQVSRGQGYFPNSEKQTGIQTSLFLIK